jgi:hypothetical protein
MELSKNNNKEQHDTIKMLIFTKICIFYIYVSYFHIVKKLKLI